MFPINFCGRCCVKMTSFYFSMVLLLLGFFLCVPVLLVRIQNENILLFSIDKNSLCLSLQDDHEKYFDHSIGV